LIENHYRYYQFYSNMFIAAAFSYWARVFSEVTSSPNRIGATFGFLALEMILFAGSRDTLQKYYTRTQQLLNSRNP